MPSSSITFEALRKCFADSLAREAYHLTLNSDESLDLSQEVWLQAWLHRDTLRAPEAARAWLHQTLVRLFIDRRRRALARPVTVPLDAPTEANGLSIAETLRDPGASPEQVLLRHVEHAVVRELVDRLQPDQRTAIVLHDLEGWEYEEFPGDEPLSTWRNRRARGLKTLQQLATRPDPRLDILRSAA